MNSQAWVGTVLIAAVTGCSLVVPGPGDLTPGHADAGQADERDAGSRDADTDGGVDAATESDAGSPDAGADGGACSSACTSDTPYCDVPADRCVACLGAEHCDDRDPCTVDRCLDGMCRHDATPDCITHVWAGWDRTCAQRGRDTPLCWGRNHEGQLGDGTTTDRHLPTPMALTGSWMFSQLGAGIWHTCASTPSRHVFCVGWNMFGQLGDNSTTNTSTPVQVSGLLDTAEVTAGFGFSCARRSTGDVVCWGHNPDGQHGTGTVGGMALIPGDSVAGLLDATQLSSRYMHVCALRATGEVACWGQGGHGQLGDGETLERNAPVMVLGLTDIVEVSAGRDSTCALASGGVVYCWGNNFSGQLGDDSTVSRPTPAPVSGIADAVQIAVGDGGAACVRHASGRVSCWGANGAGQLGDGTRANSSVPVQVEGLLDAIDISVGGLHACARRSTDQLVCWGSNEYGQLGIDSTVDQLTPVEVMGLW